MVESSQAVLERNIHGRAWLMATQSLDWWNCDVDLVAGSFSELLSTDAPNTCLLKSTQILEKQFRGVLRPSVRDTLARAIHLGITIQSHWPRTWSMVIDQWLGKRFYVSSITNFMASERYAGIACSHIGRHGCHLPDWPSRLDAALQHIHRNELRPLVVRDTTLCEPLRQFSKRANLRNLEVVFDHQRTSATEWLVEKLRQMIAFIGQDDSSDCWNDLMKSTVELSPPLDQPVSELGKFPIQDRVLAGLSDWLAVVHARESGTVWQLSRRRLGEDAFPTAGTYVMIGSESKEAEPATLLGNGAVGWLLPHCQQTTLKRHYCKSCPNRARSPYVQSVCMPLHALTSKEIDEDHWDYLSHCTRGGLGPKPNESIEKYLDRVWTSGHVTESSPIETLMQILDEGRLRGNSRLTRTPEPCISFSAVPLNDLLKRRRFQSHLGRWDWEPYGILIQRKALVECGARPVIYGDADDFKKLSAIDQPYFQARGKVNKHTHQDWTAEREWRMVGDLALDRLPSSAIKLFVQTRSQAENLSRCYPMAVVWIEGNA